VSVSLVGQLAGSEGELRDILAPAFAAAAPARADIRRLAYWPAQDFLAEAGDPTYYQERSAFVDRPFGGAALAAGFIDTALFTLIPVYGVRAGQSEELAVLTLGVFTAGNLFLQYPLGWIADHTDRRWTAITTAAIIAAGADLLVAGTATFQGGAGAYAENIRRLRRSR